MSASYSIDSPPGSQQFLNRDNLFRKAIDFLSPVTGPSTVSVFHNGNLPRDPKQPSESFTYLINHQLVTVMGRRICHLTYVLAVHARARSSKEEEGRRLSRRLHQYHQPQSSSESTSIVLQVDEHPLRQLTPTNIQVVVVPRVVLPGPS